MFFNTLKKSTDGLMRNALTTIPTIVVIAIVLTLFHGLLAVREQADQALVSLQQKFSITIYLKDSADPIEISKLIDGLEARPDVVRPVIYTSKEDAWNSISKTFSLDNDLLKKYQFSLPASITITPKFIENTDQIESYLNNQASNLLKDSTVANSKQKNIAAQMLGFISNLKETTVRTILLFSALFLLGAALLIGNALYLTMTARHREISIMKIMGASSSSIILPFVFEGVLIGLFSFVLHFLFSFALPIRFENIANEETAFLVEFAASIIWAGSVSFVVSRLFLKKSAIF